MVPVIQVIDEGRRQYLRDSAGFSINLWGKPLVACFQWDFLPFSTILWTQVISQFLILCTVHLTNLHFKLVCEDVGEAMSAILKWR